MQHTRHIVHRQSLEVAFERPGQKPGMQERLAAVYYQRILPELDKVFGEFERESHGGLTIPMVSIDCGILHEANWEDELAANALRGVWDELQRYRNSPKAHQQVAQQWNAEFIHFLRTGTFQWDSRKEVPADYEGRLVLDDPFLDELTAALRLADDVLKRLFHYCTSDFITRLADALAIGRIPPEGAAYVRLLKQVGAGAAMLSTAVVDAYCAIYCRPSVGKESFAVALTERVWPMIGAAHRVRIVERIGQFPFLDVDFITALLPLISSEFPDWAAVIQQQGTIQLREAQGLQVEKKAPTANPLPRAEQKMEEKIRADRVVDTYYINNAGLVLAYPFIAPLLQHTGFMDDERQFFPEAKDKATVLLQHLVYESPLAEEGELPLNKILVGLQPTSFVDPLLFEYTPQVQRECEDALEAIIAHWSVLRNTSVAGLRETFLQRGGKLTSRTDGWLLQVDSHGVDVLLASLPWSIGIVKLPWMDGITYVEWA